MAFTPETDRMEETAFQLRRLLVEHGTGLAERHAWIAESERWTELVFSILIQYTSQPELLVRGITEELSDLDLIDVDALLTVRGSDGGPDLQTSAARRIMDVLRSSDFGDEEAVSSAVVGLYEVAVGLKEHFGGKIQLYLRHYGELMLAELDRFFGLDELGAEKAGAAFTYWLQNVALMPLSLVDANVRRLCMDLGIESKQLVEAADHIDLNLALLDDLVQRHYVAEQKMSEEKLP